MAIPKKVVDFFLENKDKPKEKVIKEMMKKFKYKKSTALSYYSSRSDDVKNIKEIVFKFLEENPDAVYDIFNKEYVNKLGISNQAYATYKSEYKILNSIEVKKDIKEWDKYYKGRLRKKFAFDDSKLFG